VHGWDGKRATMQAIEAALQQARLPVHSYIFDYSSHNTDWASRPTVAGCLSAYITAISAGYRNAGGDGKVIVIAHSMGGLATRFASSPLYSSTPIASDLGALITVDTPSLGSPFGNQTLARAMQALPVFGAFHPTSLLHGTFMNGFQTPAGTDASICLALHDPPRNALPNGCAVAPYLPADIRITQLAGDITLKRTLFGIHLYNVDFAADGPVSVQSAHSYGVSGPGGRAPLGTLAEDQPTLSCTVNFDDVVSLLAGAGIAGAAGVLASLPATIEIDNAAVDEQLAGNTGKAYDALLYGSYLFAPCSHDGMLSWGPSLQTITAAVKGDLKALDAARTALLDEAPVDQHGIPRPGLTIAYGGVASSCGAGSDSVGNAYRCFSGHVVYDPCWADNATAADPSVVCQLAPWDTTVTRLGLATGLEPFMGYVPIDQSFPWGVQLADGERCVAEQGAHDNYNGRIVDYACGSNYTHVLLRPIRWAGQEAAVDSAYYHSAGNGYTPGPTETITTAWYAIPDGQPLPHTTDNCSLPGGAEGGSALPFSATGVACAPAQAVVKDVSFAGGGGPCKGANMTGQGCDATLGFLCRILQPMYPGRADPGDVVVCENGSERIIVSLPG